MYNWAKSLLISIIFEREMEYRKRNTERKREIYIIYVDNDEMFIIALKSHLMSHPFAKVTKSDDKICNSF